MLSKKIELLVLPSVENIDDIVNDLDVILTKAYYSSIQFIFKDNEVKILANGRDINTFDFVWLSSYWATRDLAMCVELYLDRFKVKHTYIEKATSKITDSMVFLLNDIICPDTYYVEDTNILDHIETIEDTCGYPMIMKDTKGCGGSNAAFILNREELLSNIESRKNSRKYMFQRFIENEYDWGVLVANGEVVSGEKSYPKDGEFRNNVGATEVFVDVCDIPENVKDIALKGSKILDLSWSRSDIVIDKISGLPYLLEVNRFPGITYNSAEVTGANSFIKFHLDTLTI